MTDKPSDESFVQSWIGSEKREHPDSEIVKALARFTTKSELDEAKLLASLKVMAKPQAKADA